MDFKVPSTIYQDLQIIQDIVGDLPPPKAPSPKPSAPHDDSIDSSDESDAASEKEVEADILGGHLDSDDDSPPSRPTGSTSDLESSSDSDSDSDSENEPRTSSKLPQAEDLLMDDDEDGGGVVSPDQVKTKNEVADVNIVIPEVEKLEDHEIEKLQKVGEVYNIIDKVVIVKGLPQHLRGRESDRALDSDTLLVFDDGRVLGYIWETFGPTTQPFYRVQFSEAYPLDSEKVRLSREVFHVPGRSKFVSISALKYLRGSDASNAHDEEPAEDELEFSDDEAEREHKRALKDRRAGVDPGSRQTTPGPSRMKDTETSEDLYGMSPYDNMYNDMDFGAGPSRPPPMPYDDPYSDSYGLPSGDKPASQVRAEPPQPERVQSERPQRGRGRGRGAGRDTPGRGRGRGRGQDRQKDNRGRRWARGGGSGGAGGGAGEYWSGSASQNSGGTTAEYDPRTSRPLSPTSMAIARATGQYSDGGTYSGVQQGMNGYSSGGLDSAWGYQQYPSPYGDGYGYQPPYSQPYVQPHINPRFASAFGMNMGQTHTQFQGYPQYGAGYVPPGHVAPPGDWAQWTSGQSNDGASGNQPEAGTQSESQ